MTPCQDCSSLAVQEPSTPLNQQRTALFVIAPFGSRGAAKTDRIEPCPRARQNVPKYFVAHDTLCGMLCMKLSHPNENVAVGRRRSRLQISIYDDTPGQSVLTHGPLHP